MRKRRNKGIYLPRQEINILEGEEWRAIEGFEGHYEVSSFGRLKSLERYVPHSRSGQQKIHARILRLNDSPNNGEFFLLTCSVYLDGVKYDTIVSHVVWETFNGPIPEGHWIVYKDFDVRNLRLDNLTCMPKAEAIIRRNERNGWKLLDSHTKELTKTRDYRRENGLFKPGHVQQWITRRNKCETS